VTFTERLDQLMVAENRFMGGPAIGNGLGGIDVVARVAKLTRSALRGYDLLVVSRVNYRVAIRPMTSAH
jgi:hypothetical protein